MFGELKKEPFCQCLHEIENGLPRSKHCFQTCNDQWLILAKRKEEKDKVIKHLNGVSKQQAIVWGFKDHPQGITFENLAKEVENETNTGKQYTKMYYNTMAGLKNDLIKDLMEVEDQKAIIYLSPEKQISIEELIKEIENESVLGVEYLNLLGQVEKLITKKDKSQ